MRIAKGGAQGGLIHFISSSLQIRLGNNCVSTIVIISVNLKLPNRHSKAK